MKRMLKILIILDLKLAWNICTKNLYNNKLKFDVTWILISSSLTDLIGFNNNSFEFNR